MENPNFKGYTFLNRLPVIIINIYINHIIRSSANIYWNFEISNGLCKMFNIPTSLHFSTSSLLVKAVNPIIGMVGIYSFYIIPLNLLVVIQPSKIGIWQSINIKRYPMQDWQHLYGCKTFSIACLPLNA